MTTCRECGCDSDMRDHCDHMSIVWNDCRNCHDCSDREFERSHEELYAKSYNHADLPYHDSLEHENIDPMCTDCYHVFTKKEDQSWLFQRMFQ